MQVNDNFCSSKCQFQDDLDLDLLSQSMSYHNDLNPLYFHIAGENTSLYNMYL